LEQLGFEVMTSESADFPHSLAGEAWKAALAPIETSDYFVLLVGARAGWITSEGISVTRAEFQLARELHRKSGRPRIVVLVRQSVLAAINARPEAGPDESDNWPAVVELVREIQNSGAEPDTTWVHGFATFEEAATTLQTALRVTGPLRRRVQEANLLDEFRSNGQELLMRLKELVIPTSHLLVVVPKAVDALDRDSMGRIALFRFAIPARGHLSASAVDNAISSGEFLEFDPASGAMSAGPIQSALLVLRSRLSRYETLLGLVESATYAGEFAAMTPNGGRQRPSQDFLEIVWAIRDELENIENLTRALARFLLGLDADWVGPELNDLSPDRDQAARIKAEAVERAQVDAWFAQQ
jgi:hypothetical protein